MMWEAPLWLIGVPVALAVLGAGVLRRLRTAGRASDDPESLRHVSVDRGRIRELAGASRRRAGLVFFWLGAAFLCVALARPQWGWINLPRFEQAREVVIALDLSKSMLAEDVKPSRLARSRLLVENLLDFLRGERVGLVLFAGSAFTQSPLSADYEVLREFLPELEPSYLPQGGTDYAAMLDTSLEAFGGAGSGEADRYLIILSDGESLSDDWQSRVEPLKEAGVRVIGLGVGTPQGSVIPDPGGGVVKDRNGSVVLSRLNASTLQALARRTGGAYRQADVWVDLPALLSETVEAGRKGEFSEQRDRRPIERYQIPLLAAILFWILSLWREFPVRPRNLAGKDIGSGEQSDSPVKLRAATPSPPPLPVLLALLLFPCALTAQVPGGAGATAPAQRLAGEVAKLSRLSSLGGRDYATLAQTTIEAGKAAMEAQQPLPRGAIEDALDAVFRGEAADPQAADWETLRTELEKLLEQSPEDPSRKSQDKDDQQSQDGGQSKEQKQNSEGGGQNSKQQNQESQNQGESSEDGEQQQGENQSSVDQENPEENSGGEGGQDENQNNQNQASEPPADPSGQEGSERNEQNTLGELNQDGEESDSPKPESNPPNKPEKMQTVSGSKTGGERSRSDNPQMAAALQRLEKISDGDVPAELFRALNPNRQTPEKDGKDW